MIFYNVNLINLLYLQLTFTIVVLGSLMSLIEHKLPNSIRQMFRYGKHAHTGDNDELIKRIEIPKSWFSHFYVFAIFWSWFWLILTISVYFYGYQPGSLLLNYLDLSCGSDRAAESELEMNFDFSTDFNIKFFFSFTIRDLNSAHSLHHSVHAPLHRKQLSSDLLEKV